MKPQIVKGHQSYKIGAERDSESGDGQLDSYLRVFLNLESFDENTGEMKFYLNVCTCDEAPYFRLKYSQDLLESEFTVKTLAQLKTIGAKQIKKAIAVLS